MFVFRSSSGPLDAAETPATPGPKMPPMSEQTTTTKAERRTDRTERDIDTSLSQYTDFSWHRATGWQTDALTVAARFTRGSVYALRTERRDPAEAASVFTGLRWE